MLARSAEQSTALLLPRYDSCSALHQYVSNIRLISLVSDETVSAIISRMRAFCGVRLSAATNPASRSATLSSITRPLPDRDDCTTTTPALAACSSAAFAVDGAPEGNPAETIPFAPAATAASTNIASAPA